MWITKFLAKFLKFKYRVEAGSAGYCKKKKH